jgi:hypothetical protein
MVRKVKMAGSVFIQSGVAGSTSRIEEHPAVSSDLIGILLAFFLLLR